MPRPRSKTEAEVLQAAARVIGRRGPAEFTLREVGDEIGLSASTLVQRYKSKRGLLVALVESSAANVDGWFDGARGRSDGPLEALLEALSEGARAVGRPQEAAHHLAFLQLGLSDPALGAPARRFFTNLRARIRGLVEDAIDKGELARGTKAAALAHAVEACYHGAILAWAAHREGTAESNVREVVTTLLDGHRPRGVLAASGADRLLP